MSGQQVADALGSDKVDELSKATGLSQTEVTDHLAEQLPSVVDHLTPEGQVPDQSKLKGPGGPMTPPPGSQSASGNWAFSVRRKTTDGRVQSKEPGRWAGLDSIRALRTGRCHDDLCAMEPEVGRDRFRLGGVG